jgi:hypothetical protein
VVTVLNVYIAKSGTVVMTLSGFSYAGLSVGGRRAGADRRHSRWSAEQRVAQPIHVGLGDARVAQVAVQRALGFVDGDGSDLSNAGEQVH